MIRPLGPQVIGVQVGQPKEYVVGTRVIRSAIDKVPVTGTISIGRLGLAGDIQVNRRFHGGPERAVCVYPAGHLQAWSALWGEPLQPGSFGENLTVMGLDEHGVHIGDRFRFGSALLEVTQPREPCRTLAARFRRDDLPTWIRATSRTGWYMRVLEPGEAKVALPFIREHEDPDGVSVAEAYRVRIDRGCSREELRRVLRVDGLSSGWRVSLGKRA
jgi:MOSC domain-containing protein YiiM